MSDLKRWEPVDCIDGVVWMERSIFGKWVELEEAQKLEKELASLKLAFNELYRQSTYLSNGPLHECIDTFNFQDGTSGAWHDYVTELRLVLSKYKKIYVN